jgi:hypothetical protein
MYNQRKQDEIAKDVKKLVLGRTRHHNGNWGFLGYEITKKSKAKNKARKPLVDIKMSKGKQGATNFNIDYPDSWDNIFKGKKSPKKRAVRYKTTVRDVTNQKLIR